MKVSAKSLPCDCGGRAEKGFASDTFIVDGKSVTVGNIPAFICSKCGERYFDGPTVIKIEKDLKKYGTLKSQRSLTLV